MRAGAAAMIRETSGLLPAEQLWHEWFAWYPVRACGRIRWLDSVQRRFIDATGSWHYAAGRAHDHPDSNTPFPIYQVIHTCRYCGALFTIGGPGSR
jgi:hypothetical protein